MSIFDKDLISKPSLREEYMDTSIRFVKKRLLQPKEQECLFSGDFERLEKMFNEALHNKWNVMNWSKVGIRDDRIVFTPIVNLEGPPKILCTEYIMNEGDIDWIPFYTIKFTVFLQGLTFSHLNPVRIEWES